ncbi:MAG: hypothetical protein CM15mP98_04730 [Paracoccaceae bacterium]|nr:MAG: hypothetical protein CM15mP98_04730 [Paracoccaceae bacterium]
MVVTQQLEVLKNGAHPAGNCAGFAVLTFLSPDKLYDSYAGALFSDDLIDLFRS